ncbi:MAG: V-type ATP synthase subunit D [Synergistaceae bacterium]|jgi:V/A-type H+-transporting ATPase subunit D|nr:V-type ATP synthase subunit D [Synergistaceae bacterium]
MARRIAPTRGNLVKLQKSMAQAENGHDLLEQKRQVLMLELVRHIDSARDLQRDVIKTFEDSYKALQIANISLGIDTVEDIADSIPSTDEIVVRLRSVMGVEIPDIDEIDPSIKPGYSFINSTAAMDDAYLSFRKVLSTLLKLAEVETSVYRLAVQIRRTHRRVNALEKVVIPSDKEKIAFINGVLEESEREDFVRMKIAKENREKKNSPQDESKAV